LVTRVLGVALGALALLHGLTAQAAAPKEYQVKAVFLFNFTHFVEWPPAAFASATAPLTICVVGDDPFGRALDDTIAGESIGARRLAVRRPHRTESLDACQLLFVSRSEAHRLDEVLRMTGTSTSILTVSDIDRFVARGGDVGFFLDRDRVRFEISIEHAKRRGLKVQSQLLSLARIVATEDGAR
jgi:hypothetical protein